ncbi:hypothetical protein HPB50_000910 [Hyalomma asiaticum]|uniref:Uncharacterized protein n=1 Tax=Hyalomma asiaticum TaxID=266040 RepID=A0ACB7TCV6_HYAAI|nr:hypothetical protein HPB50_000910 [Hyalomma asiaticum]
MEKAESCFRYIKDIFDQLEEFRAFELLRSGLDRSRYLLVKEAKVIAMTCTHAALKRRELVDLGFKYDNILMEESAQILEIETFIPLLLQTPQDGYNRLKRWIMIGDHHQLPPVVKNMAFQKYSNMEQSLFTRFVRLGVPVVQLDGQGRSRPSLCNLYNWRYQSLGNLPHVTEWPEYRTGNAGFCFDYQIIDVGDFNGIGESEPNPYFYQNLAEAEYVVAVFMYMRLLGYPAERISILTTYNGQKHLIRDVVRQRCQDNPLIGCPLKVTTVDKYQGQQNDYVLLSLVRTRAVGHLRDVRRLVVAMSRARLGLYVFARISLFQDCFELGPTFNLLLQRPTQLWLAPWEVYPTGRPNSVPPQGNPYVITGMTQMAQFVYDFYQQRLDGLTAQLKAQKVVYEKPPTTIKEVPKETVRAEQPVSESEPAVAMDVESEEPSISQPEVPAAGDRSASIENPIGMQELVVGRKKLSYSPQKEAHVGQLLAVVLFRVGSLIARLAIGGVCHVCPTTVEALGLTGAGAVPVRPAATAQASLCSVACGCGMAIAPAPQTLQGARPTSSDSMDYPKKADLGRPSRCCKAQDECRPLALSGEYRHIALNASKELLLLVVAEGALHDARAIRCCTSHFGAEVTAGTLRDDPSSSLVFSVGRGRLREEEVFIISTSVSDFCGSGTLAGPHGCEQPSVRSGLPCGAGNVATEVMASGAACGVLGDAFLLLTVAGGSAKLVENGRRSASLISLSACS